MIGKRLVVLTIWIGTMSAALGCTSVDGDAVPADAASSTSRPSGTCRYATDTEVSSAYGGAVQSTPPSNDAVACEFEVAPADTPASDEPEVVQLEVLSAAEYPQARTSQCADGGIEVTVGNFVGHDCKPDLMVDLEGDRGLRIYASEYGSDRLMALAELFAPRVDRQG